jgi:hypothetical protein
MVIDRMSPTKRPQEPVVMRQVWQKLLFLHWEVEAEAVQRLLPPGLTVDTFEGRAYVGLIPFTMREVRPVWSPPVRGVSDFHETNVRTYVHREGKEPGVWFFSLDAANPIAVQIARTLWKLPYFFARMSLFEREGEIVYASERVAPKPIRGVAGGTVGCTVRYRPLGSPKAALPDTLEFFLVERYILYSHDGTRLYSGRVHHTPYPIQKVEVREWHESLIGVTGLSTPSTSPIALFVEGVSVEIFPLHPLSE